VQLPVKDVKEELIDGAMIPMLAFHEHFKDGGIEEADGFRVAAAVLAGDEVVVVVGVPDDLEGLELCPEATVVQCVECLHCLRVHIALTAQPRHLPLSHPLQLQICLDLLVCV
jgi:hypothetical protein